MILENFRLGGVSSQELINAQNELLKAEELFISNKVDIYFKIKLLNFYKSGTIN